MQLIRQQRSVVGEWRYWPGAGRGLVQVVLFRLALLARLAFRPHLPHPQLSQRLVDLTAEFADR